MTNTKQQYTLFSLGSALIFFVASQVFKQVNIFASLHINSAIFFSMVLGLACFLLHCFFQDILKNFYKRSIFIYLTLFILPFIQLLTLPLSDTISILFCILFLGFNYKLFFAQSFGILPCLVFGFPILVLNPLFLPILLSLTYFTFSIQKEKSYLIFSAYMIPFLFYWIHLSELDANSGFFSLAVIQWLRLNQIMTLPDVSISALLILFFLFVYPNKTKQTKLPVTSFIISFFFIALILNHQSLLFVLFTCLYLLTYLLNPKAFEQIKLSAEKFSSLIGLAIFLYFFYLRAILPIVQSNI